MYNTPLKAQRIPAFRHTRDKHGIQLADDADAEGNTGET